MRQTSGITQSSSIVCLQVQPAQPELQTVLRMLASAIDANARDPMRPYLRELKRTVYGNSRKLQDVKLSDLRKLDAHAACQHFSAAFRNPAEFTLCFGGALPLQICSCHVARRPA